MIFTVLLAEDEQILRDLLVELISPLSLDVIQCASADEALGHLEHKAVDLLLSDIRMPGHLDGWELAEIVWVRWPELPVILTSGHMQVTAQQMPENSVFIPKPWKLDVLYDAVEHCVER